MENKKLNDLLESHIQSDDKEFIKNYKENPPHVIEELQWQPGEGIISELSAKDLIQLLSRYLNNDGVYIKNILHFLLRIEKMMEWLLEANGVDVKAKFKEDAKKAAEQMELTQQAIKEKLQNLK